MQRLNFLLIIFSIFFAVLTLGYAQPSTKPILTDPISQLPIIDKGIGENRRTLAGFWSLKFDMAKMTASAEPVYKENLRLKIKTPEKRPVIKIISYDKASEVMDIDVTIFNPLEIFGYDFRIIVYTDDIGHRLLNQDGWTSFHDLPGGLNVNPFKACKTSDSRRKILPTGQFTENLKILMPRGYLDTTFSVDVSYSDNCAEPYGIKSFTQDALFDTKGSSTPVSVIVMDWQKDVKSVSLFCPDVTGTSIVPLNKIDSEKWGATITNSDGAQEGLYTGYLISTSEGTGTLALYSEIKLLVGKSSQNRGFARAFGGVSNDEIFDIAVDKNGNIYLVGSYKKSVDFDPGPGVEIHETGGNMEIFLSKFNTSGDFEWVITFGDGSYREGRGLACDSSGNVYMTGLFSSEIDFDPGPAVEIRKPCTGDTDVFLVKYSPDRDFIWVQTFGGTGRESGEKLAVDSSNNIFVAGHYDDSADFNPGPAEDIHKSNGNKDIFLSKFSHDGDFIWARTWGGPSFIDSVEDIAVGDNNDIHVTGCYSESVDFDPGSGKVICKSSGSEDIFLSKFDPSGNLKWAKSWGGTSNDTGSGVAVDYQGNIYVTGDFWISADFDPGKGEDIHKIQRGNSNAFLSKFNRDGNFLWARTWGGSNDRGSDMVVDRSGMITVSGLFSGISDFDPSPCVDERLSEGEDDNFITRFDSDGNYQWARTWKNKGFRCSGRLAIDDGGNIFLTSEYYDTVNLNPGVGVDEHTSEGLEDIFLIKMLPCGYW